MSDFAFILDKGVDRLVGALEMAVNVFEFELRGLHTPGEEWELLRVFTR